MENVEKVDTRPLNVRSEYQSFNQSTLKTIQKSLSKNFSIVLFNVRTSGNIGMTIRSACLLGCKEVIICGRKKFNARFSIGSEHYIPIIYWDTPLKVSITCKNPFEFRETLEYNPKEFAKMCGDNTPVFLEQSGDDITTVKWQTIRNVLLIVGNESCGIPGSFINDVKKLIPGTQTVSIPQWSVMRSMNVAVAASIAMWEITKVV